MIQSRYKNAVVDMRTKTWIDNMIRYVKHCDEPVGAVTLFQFFFANTLPFPHWLHHIPHYDYYFSKLHCIPGSIGIIFGVLDSCCLQQKKNRLNHSTEVRRMCNMKMQRIFKYAFYMSGMSKFHFRRTDQRRSVKVGSETSRAELGGLRSFIHYADY